MVRECTHGCSTECIGVGCSILYSVELLQLFLQLGLAAAIRYMCDSRRWTQAPEPCKLPRFNTHIIIDAIGQHVHSAVLV